MYTGGVSTPARTMEAKLAPAGGGGGGEGYGATLSCSQEQEEKLPKYTGYTKFLGQTLGSSMTISITQPDMETSFCAMSANKKLCLYAFFFVDFCAGTFYSLLGPFFPNEARAKGISYTLTGFVFSVYPVVYIIVSPLIGRYLSKIGAKFVFVTGIGVCGSCAILFGLLEYIIDGTTYAVMCIVVRAFQATGGVAFNTATFAMVATMFPAQMATMFGLLEVAFGLGTMLGPPVGGWMYEVGGFKLPFIVSGTTLLCMGLVCFCFVPSMRESQSRSRSLWGILLSPLVMLVGLTGATGTSGIGFLDVTLSVRLNTKFNLTPGWTGLVFFVAPCMFVLSAPVWGRLADKKPAVAPIAMGLGTLIGGTAFWFMGPATFLPLPDDQLWLLIVSYGVMGLAIGTHVVNGKIVAEEARRRGYPKNLETMGVLAGLITSFNSVGSFSGPLVGGYLNDRFNFPGATVVVGIIVMSVGSLLLLCVLLQCLVRRRSQSHLQGENSMLLSDDSQDTSPTPTGHHISISSSGTTTSSIVGGARTPLFIRKQGHVTSSSPSPEVGSFYGNHQGDGEKEKKARADEKVVPVGENQMPENENVVPANAQEDPSLGDWGVIIRIPTSKDCDHDSTTSSQMAGNQDSSDVPVVITSVNDAHVGSNPVKADSDFLNDSDRVDQTQEDIQFYTPTTGFTGHDAILQQSSGLQSGKESKELPDSSDIAGTVTSRTPMLEAAGGIS